MKKLIVTITLILLMSILMFGCATTKTTQEPPKLIITIGEKQLVYIIAKNQWNGAIYDRESTTSSYCYELYC